MLKILVGENSKDLLQLTPRTPFPAGRKRTGLDETIVDKNLYAHSCFDAKLFFSFLSPHDPIPNRICIENLFMVHLNRSSVRLSSVG
jgi:hypothetical protein